MSVKSIPDGYHSVTPYLVVSDVARLIQFAEDAFGARVKERVEGPGGMVMHAEVVIGDSPVMMGQAMDKPPVPACLYLYLQDVDAAYKKALSAGGTSISEPSDQFYGDRNAGVKDPTDNQWWLATHVEDVTSDEIRRRTAGMAKGGGCG